MFTWEEAGLLRGMMQVLAGLLVIVLLLAAFWIAGRVGWLAPVL
jgi:hypothetical protein